MPSHTVSSSTTPSNPPVKKEAQQSWEKQQVLTIAQPIMIICLNVLYNLHVDIYSLYNYVKGKKIISFFLQVLIIIATIILCVHSRFNLTLFLCSITLIWYRKERGKEQRRVETVSY